MDVPIGSMWTKNVSGFVPLWSACGACGKDNIASYVGDRDTVVVLSRPGHTFDEHEILHWHGDVDIRVLTSSGVVGWLSRSAFDSEVLKRVT